MAAVSFLRSPAVFASGESGQLDFNRVGVGPLALQFSHRSSQTAWLLCLSVRRRVQVGVSDPGVARSGSLLPHLAPSGTEITLAP
jgi:hypothetical protein